MLSVQGETLTPTSAATLELFARQVGGALENVRHHRLAASRLAELSRLQSELVAQERLTVLGEAAGVVAHEVRNPLGSILNAVAVLKRDKLGPVGTSAVEMLEEEATRLDAMVRDLLDVVRPLEPRPRPLHPGELARRTLELFHERRQLGTVRVTVDEAPGLPTIHADETLLQLALENLLRNAVQASPAGGQVRVAVESVPGGVCLTVEDQGPGVSSGDAQRIFEPFFTTRTTGTGLGLAVVRRVVLAHGGTVSVGQRPEVARASSCGCHSSSRGADEGRGPGLQGRVHSRRRQRRPPLRTGRLRPSGSPSARMRPGSSGSSTAARQPLKARRKVAPIAR